MRAAAVLASAAVALAVAAVAGLLLAPAASARPATLYAHVTGPGDSFALNMQAPPDPFTLDAGFGGALAATATCVPANPAYTPSDLHRLHGFASPHEVGYSSEGVEVRPERGLYGDVRILGSPMLHWYWSAEGVGPGSAPVPAPEVVVRATLRESDAIDADDLAYEEGALIAVGESEPALLAGAASQGIEHDEVDGRTVYHFVVPMEVDDATAVLPGVAFSLWVETFVRSEACDDGSLMPPAVRLHSSPGHRPRLELDAAPHLALQSTFAQVLEPEGGPASLVFYAMVLDAWGHYDVTSIEAWAEGPGLELTPLSLLPDLQSTEHRLGRTAALVTAWGLEGDSFAAGNYTFRLAGSTLQGLNETWEVTYRLGDEPEAPGLTPALVGLAVVAAAWRSRRRRERPGARGRRTT